MHQLYLPVNRISNHQSRGYMIAANAAASFDKWELSSPPHETVYPGKTYLKAQISPIQSAG